MVYEYCFSFPFLIKHDKVKMIFVLQLITLTILLSKKDVDDDRVALRPMLIINHYEKLFLILLTMLTMTMILLI